MKYGWSNRRALAAAVASVLLGSVAYADDVADMLVTATVAPACQITNVPTIAFGLLDPLVNNDAQGIISWRCTNGFATEIQLDGGGSGNIAARRMVDGHRPVAVSALHGPPGGPRFSATVSRATSVPVTGTGYATSADVTVYGRVLQADAAAAPGGNYGDTVVVTIVF